MSAGKAVPVVVAATIGAVEALKDQGVCRWNFIIRSLHQHLKNDVRSALAGQFEFRASLAAAAASVKKPTKSEASMNRVVELNCWGPSSVRF